MSANDLLLNYHDAVIYRSDLALLDSQTDWLNDACINFQMTRLRQAATTTQEKVTDPNRQGKGTDVVEILEDLFLDPSVVSFLVHQLTEDDEDYGDELSSLNAAWNLPQSRTSNKRKRIFVPISDQFGESKAAFARPGGGNHWSILLWEVNALTGVEFYHFDSSRGVNRTAAEVVAKKLHKVLCASMSPHDDVAYPIDVVECRSPQQRNGHDCGLFAIGFAEALSGTDDHFVAKERRESLLRDYFEENGGHLEFASRLRNRIGDEIRELTAGGVGTR